MFINSFRIFFSAFYLNKQLNFYSSMSCEFCMTYFFVNQFYNKNSNILLYLFQIYEILAVILINCMLF